MPIDEESGIIRAGWRYELQKGHTPPALDSLVAATALVHGLTVATRNSDDFPDVPRTNPWEDE